MAAKHPALKLITYGLLFALLFFGLLQITLQLRGKVFVLEAFGTVLLALLVLAGGLNFHRSSGEKIFFAVFLLIIANLLLLRAFTSSLYVAMLFFAFVGFVLSLLQRKKTGKQERGEKQEQKERNSNLERQSEKQEEPHSLVFETQTAAESGTGDEKEDSDEKGNEKNKNSASKNSVSYEPGKYVCSSRGNVYHEAKCDWAKKVSKTHRLWFNSRKEAEDKGYKPHNCVN